LNKGFEAYENMIEGRETEEKEKRNAVVGDAMRNMRVFFVRGECGEGGYKCDGIWWDED